MEKQQLLTKLEKTWTAFNASYAEISDAQLTEPGVMGEWSVKDIIAHVSTWEEEALTFLPLILAGRRPPRYRQFGGIDAFNARMTEQKRSLALSEVLQQRDDTHQRLINYLQEIPEEHFTAETRFRHRLRLDTYSHYSLHTRAIQEWQRSAGNFMNDWYAYHIHERETLVKDPLLDEHPQESHQWAAFCAASAGLLSGVGRILVKIALIETNSVERFWFI